MLPPVVLLLAVYLWVDPFKVVWYYDSYYVSGAETNIGYNKDYISTTNFNNRYEHEHYNSFIFGNSRSIVFTIAASKKHLPIDAKPYHFDASKESLFGLYKKLQYLDAKNVNLKNALIVIDHSLLAQDKQSEGTLFVNAPQQMGYSNFGEFHYTYLKAFYSYKFLYPYLDYNVSGTIKPYMRHELFEQQIAYEPVTNEVSHTYEEQEITNGTFYTPQRMENLYKRPAKQRFYKTCLTDAHKKMLTEIAAILQKHRCNYKVIISPLYDQKKLAPTDMAYLKKVFGNHIYDFSGINAITNNYTNYYENSHYREHVANTILDSIY